MRLLEGGVKRPHFAAQIENVKNDLVSNLLENIGFEPRIQPYTCYGSTKKLRVLARVLLAGANSKADHHDQPVHDMHSLARRGFRNFTSQISPYTDITIQIPQANNGKGLEILTQSDRAGLIDEVIDAELEPGWQQIILSTKNQHSVTADVLIVGDEQETGIISDIDDTVMVTLLPRPLLAAWNAFVISQASRRVVPGMPVLYQKLLRQYSSATPVIYLSTGAWNVSPVLQRFLFKNGYPCGPLLLTDWGPTNTGFFRSGQEHKRRSLKSLYEMFPNMKWFLIGDDGQHDPHIYADFAAEQASAVKAILIRELTKDQQDLAHGGTRPLRAIGAAARSVRASIPKIWGTKESQAAGLKPVNSDANVSEGSLPPRVGAENDLLVRKDTKVPYFSAKDGFELINLLTKHRLLGESDNND